MYAIAPPRLILAFAALALGALLAPDRTQSAEGLVSPEDGAVVVEALRRYILPTYTMAAEREIHHQVLGECGLSSGSSAANAELAAAE